MERVIESIVQQGRIVGRVRDEFGACAPIVGAQVSIYARATASGQEPDEPRGRRAGRRPEIDLSRRRPDFVVSTGPDGNFEQACAPGPYFVVCDAYGERPTQEVEVGAGCPSEVDFLIPVGLEVRSYVTREDCGPYVPCDVVTAGTVVAFRAEHRLPEGRIPDRKFIWTVSRGTLIESPDPQAREILVRTAGQEGRCLVSVTLKVNPEVTASSSVMIMPQPVQNIGGGVSVTLRRTATAPTADLPLWLLIRKSTEAISFGNYSRFMDLLLCGLGQEPAPAPVTAEFNRLLPRRALPYNDADAYRLLKVATEAFLMVNCGVALVPLPFAQADLDTLLDRVSLDGRVIDLAKLNSLWTTYLQVINGGPDATIPYLALIRDKLREVGLKSAIFAVDDGRFDPQSCFGILSTKLTHPCFLELIWSYWNEEGMLVQTLNAVSRRFQNMRGPGDRDPLANLEIDPLRPLNNLLWSYIQDEQHRLSVVRRVYEYDHHYGLTLYGKAVPALRPADSRSKFLEAFHNLLYLCTVFYQQDDDTTVIADGFPILNALKEVHLLLSQGAHNQFGDLPSTARQEMLIQQWLLARPEFREFLPTRVMVAYPERWMDRVDAMKALQGWTDTSVLHFSNLAVFGEQILLSVRFGAWSTVNDPVQAANFARFWRAEIQGYAHAYRAVTGVDLSADVADVRQVTERYLQPAVHLRNRLAMQQRSQLPGAREMAPAAPARGQAIRRRDR